LIIKIINIYGMLLALTLPNAVIKNGQMKKTRRDFITCTLTTPAVMPLLISE